MAAELDRIAADFEERGFPLVAQGIRLSAGIARQQGVPETFSNGTSEVKSALQIEQERQVENYIRLGFHKKLGMTEEGYKRSLPEIGTQPEEYKGSFNIPVVVDPRITASCQAELAGFKSYIGDAEVKGWKQNLSNKPYVAWMQDGTKNKGKSVDTVRKSLDEDEIAANIFDGIALVIAHPEILDDHAIDMPGSVVESSRAPSLDRWLDGVELYCYWTDFADDRFGSASRGK